MPTTTLLQGVTPHGSGFRVRVRFKDGVRVIETFPTADLANARALELRELRKAGQVPAATPASGGKSLAGACDDLLTRKRVQGKRKAQLRERGIEFWERSLKPWREGPLAKVPLSQLRREAVENEVLARAAAHPTSARNELQGIKATLVYAGERGYKFDPAILRIDPVRVKRRKRRALTAPQLELLAASAPSYAQRFLLFKGTTAMRSEEMFTLTDDRIDFDELTVTVLAEFCKEGNDDEPDEDKVIPITLEEAQLAREQLMARAPRTALVFPTKEGSQWTRSHFHKLVWSKAIKRAAIAWREQEGLHEDAPTPFDGLRPHDLRSTAATMMRDAGMARDVVAHRLGHADEGELLDELYDQGDKVARVRKALDAAAPAGLRAALKTGPAERSTTSAAAGPGPGEAR